MICGKNIPKSGKVKDSLGNYCLQASVEQVVRVILTTLIAKRVTNKSSKKNALKASARSQTCIFINPEVAKCNRFLAGLQKLTRAVLLICLTSLRV